MKIERLLIGALMIVGLSLRLIGVGENPVSLYWDEAAIAYDAYAIATTGNEMHGESIFKPMFYSYGDYKAPVYIWLASVSVKLLGATEVAVRLPSVIAGMILIGGVYFLGRKYISTRVGLIAAAVMTFTPYGIHFSRVGFEASVAVAVLVLAAVAGGVAKQKPVFYMLAGIFGALATYSYFSSRVVFPLVYLGQLVANRIGVKRQVWGWAIAGLVIWVGLTLPLVRSADYQASNQYRLSTPSLLNNDAYILESNKQREFSDNRIWSRIFYHRYLIWLKNWGENVLTFLDPKYLFFEGDPNLRHASGIGGIYLLPTIILLAGGILGFKAKQKWVIAWLGLWWLAAIIPASIPKEVPHALRSLNSLPPVVLLMGVGGDKLLTQLFQKSKRLAWIVLIGWIGATGWCFFNYWHDYWHHYPLRSAESWQWGYKQAALAAGEAGTNYKVIKFEPIDRINHYVWFFNRIEPQAVINKETPFIFDVAGDKLKPNCGEVSLVRASTADSFEMKPYLLTLATINDYANQPLYQLITLRCPEEMAKNGH